MKIANAQVERYIAKISEEPIAGCLIYGPEEGAVGSRSKVIAKKIVSDLADPFLVADIDLARLASDEALLLDEFFSLSMLGGRKLIKLKVAKASGHEVIVSALKVLNKKLADLDLRSQNFLLIEAGDLKKDSSLRKLCEASKFIATIACYEDDAGTFRKFVEEELKKQRLELDKNTVNFLLTKLKRNRLTAETEIAKIATYLGAQKKISPEEINLLIGAELDFNAGQLLDDFISRKPAEAITKFQKLFKETGAPIGMVRFFLGYFQKLFLAKQRIEIEREDFEVVIKSQYLFFKAEDDFRRHLRTLPLNTLAKILSDLEQLEVKMKTGQVKQEILFERFLLVHEL